MAHTRQFGAMALLHAGAGAAAGCGLSFTHGTIGRSANPHRLFAVVGVALGVFAVAFLGATPAYVAAAGGEALFRVFAAVMGVAAVLSAWGFPGVDAPTQPAPATGGVGAPAAPWPSAPRHAVAFAVFGVSCMALVQAMMFSFVERIGSERGFGFEAVSSVLIALGLVNLLPSPLAALLQRRLSPHRVLLVGPVVQAALALTISQSSSFLPYAAATAVFAAVMIFTHNFAFGLLAALDPTGRAVAATPAMLMIGAAIGPVLGGTLAKWAGYGSLGLAAAGVAALAVFSFSRARPAPALREAHA
jgi:predicted MFS family arabinose efflux permease